MQEKTETISKATKVPCFRTASFVSLRSQKVYAYH